jgi:hypothetical protein
MLFAMGFQLLLPRAERTSNKRKPGKQASARFAAKIWERSWGGGDGNGGDGKGSGGGSASTGVS